MPSGANNDDELNRPSVPTLEAQLVQSVDATLMSTGTVYDAVPVDSDGEPLTWRSRNQKYILVGIASLVIGAMAATIGMLLSSQNDGGN